LRTLRSEFIERCFLFKMYAIIETGGKQYRVTEGEEIFIEKLDKYDGEQITFDKVLVIEGDKLITGTPFISGAAVAATVIKSGKAKKITIFTYKSKKKFDRIISISTFEHIGFDEEKKDPKKAINAIKHVQSMLAKRGKCVISVPTRYNVDLDYYFREYAIQYPARVAFYMRTSETKWMLSSREKVLKQQYGSPYPCANGLIVAEFFAK